MSLSEISNVLWRERRLLDLLVFKLEEEQLVLASGRTRWLSRATREVETIREQIKRVELERAIAVQGSAAELGTSDTPSLRELAAVAPTPWEGILAEHRWVLLSLTREIDALTKSNRALRGRGSQSAPEALDTGAVVPDRQPPLRLVGGAL
jgi:FlgN protein